MDKNWSVPLILLDSLPATTSFLVAVSGGMDSVVLLDVLVKKGFNCQVAHCNFLLRGMESDEDAQFVQALANHYGLPFHSKPFQTREYAQAEGISLEMAARKLRYQWFEELRISQALDWIAIAHHQDDQIETMFLNLIRGSGIAGLTGMQLIQGKILRPLLNLPKVEIIRYCEEHGLNYRTDASNLDVSFKRNRIRHQLFPILETLNPSFRVNISETMARLADVEIQLKSEIEKVRQQIFEEDGNSFRLKLDELRKHPPTALYLFEMLRPFHFQGSIIQEMVRAMDGEAGRQFFSATHRITVDRDYLLIDPISSESDAM
ncbi:MAG: tRNA lysidine(34) synthetase TilS, partial [Marinilabiliales bacterium]|nr:tRNA lysidine(34) synthetase TilS [Marinilabiliales bacterium]